MTIKNNLSKQLLFVVGIAFILLFTSLGAILPRIITPVIETNIYNYLKEPLKVYDDTSTDIVLQDTEIAYIYIINNSTKSTSVNTSNVIDCDNIDDILMKMNKEYGKFVYNRKIYYYYKMKNGNIEKMSLSMPLFIGAATNAYSVFLSKSNMPSS